MPVPADSDRFQPAGPSTPAQRPGTSRLVILPGLRTLCLLLVRLPGLRRVHTITADGSSPAARHRADVHTNAFRALPDGSSTSAATLIVINCCACAADNAELNAARIRARVATWHAGRYGAAASSRSRNNRQTSRSISPCSSTTL